MGSHYRYKPRNFDFGEQLLLLRKRSGFTQEKIALSIGVTTKAIRNWEGGSNYPSDAHLQKLVEVYLDHAGFTPEHEQDEAHLLWDQLRQMIPRRISRFDEQWFAHLLSERQPPMTGHAQPPTGDQMQEQPAPPQPRPSTRPVAPRNAREGGLPSRSSFLLSQGGWREVPDVSAFYGRTDELAELEAWLLADHCRLVAVLGMGGIGKTALAAKLVWQAAPHFDCVLWRSLHNAPLLEDILNDWLAILDAQYALPPSSVDHSLTLFFKLMQERRCLLVLDNLETLFQEGALEGRFREGYEGYATLIEHMAEMTHHSCLVLTSREQFGGLGMVTGKHALARVFRLGSLAFPTGQRLLQDKGLFGDQATWSELVQRYAGNPLALKIVAETVQALFGGDITAFLAEGPMTFYGIHQLLQEQFERLSALEQTLMYWLAIERELTPLEALRTGLLSPVTKREVIEAMHSLRSRSLVERGEQGAVFTLHPVVLEYVTERLVELVSEEIRERRPALLLQHALLQGQARDYIRASQAGLIVQPVLDGLVSRLGSTQRLEAHLESLCALLRTLPPAQQGYGAGNIINLLVRLSGHVRGKDCSQLMIRQADLREAETQDTSFAGSDLASSVFLETMDGIVSVAFSPNGYYLAAGTNNGQILLWRTLDGQPLLTLPAHNGKAWSLVFNAESTRLISAGYDGLVKVWEISSGECVSVLRGHSRWVGLMALHPAGQLLATCSDDRSIRFWDWQAGRCLNIWHGQPSEVWAVTFSPDGRLLAGGMGDGTIKIWDCATEECLWSVTAHHGPVTCVAFSPNGELLVSGGEDATIMVWEAGTGKHLNTLTGHTDEVHSLTFNAQGLLASGSDDGTVKLWQLGRVGHMRESSQCLSTLYGHTGLVWSTAFSPDGLLASGSFDCTVKLWQLSETGEGGKCVRTLRGYSRLVNTVALSPDGRLLASDESSGRVRIWDTETGRCLRVFSRQTSEFSALAFRPDGRVFAQSFPDRTIKLWGVESEKSVRTLQGHQGEVCTTIFSADGRFLASGGVDRTIKLWEVESGRCLTTFEGHNNWVWSLAFSPDGRLLASGDHDGVVMLWETLSGKTLHILYGSPEGILALRFSPDGSRLLSSNAQDLVAVWDVASGHCLRIVPGTGDSYWLGSVTFSTDGSLLATASSDQTVKLWDVEKGELLRSFPCHVGQPWPVAFSADQRLLASGTDEGAILLWEQQTGECLMTLRSERPYERMNITAVKGITEAQIISLKALGALEKDADPKH